MINARTTAAAAPAPAPAAALQGVGWQPTMYGPGVGWLAGARVWHLPAVSNAYLQLVAGAQRRAGAAEVAVLKQMPPLGWLWANRPRAGSRAVLHLHWLHMLYQRPGAALPGWRKMLRLAARLRVARALGYHLAYTMHNTMPHGAALPPRTRADARHWWVRRQVIPQCGTVVCHCATAAAQFRQLYPPTPGTIRVVPHGSYVELYGEAAEVQRRARTAAATTTNTDAPLLASLRAQAAHALQLPVPPEALVLLFLGRMEPYKGLLGLIETFGQPQWRAPDPSSGAAASPPLLPLAAALRAAWLAKGCPPTVRLILAGAATPADAATLQAATNPDAGDIHLVLGHVPEPEVASYMALADYFVAPFTAILTSGSVHLALTFGLPPIAPAIGCLPETCAGLLPPAILYPAIS